MHREVRGCMRAKYESTVVRWYSYRARARPIMHAPSRPCVCPRSRAHIPTFRPHAHIHVAGVQKNMADKVVMRCCMLLHLHARRANSCSGNQHFYIEHGAVFLLIYLAKYTWRRANNRQHHRWDPVNVLGHRSRNVIDIHRPSGTWFSKLNGLSSYQFNMVASPVVSKKEWQCRRAPACNFNTTVCQTIAMSHIVSICIIIGLIRHMIFIYLYICIKGHSLPCGFCLQ